MDTNIRCRPSHALQIGLPFCGNRTAVWVDPWGIGGGVQPFSQFRIGKVLQARGLIVDPIGLDTGMYG